MGRAGPEIGGRIRPAAFVIVALLLAGAAWWLVRAPAMPRGTPPRLPDVDIDTPSMRAHRQAAVALATMPDDPWTFAESLAASAPASAPDADTKSCGFEDGPQFAKRKSDDEPLVQTRAATARFAEAQARVDSALRTSADPYDRVVADFVNVGNLRTDAGSDEAVVAQAAMSTDPRVVSLGHGICVRASGLSGCAALTAARWAQIDAGNGIPWIELLAQAQARGDAAGVQLAIANLAGATRFDMYFFAAPGAVVRALPDDERDLAAGNEVVTQAFGRAAALPFPTFKPLLDACRNHAGGDEQRAKQCVAISDAMYAHSDTLLPYAIAGNLLMLTTGDESRRDLIRAERQVFNAHWSPATGLSRCGMVRDEVRKLRRDAEIGEVAAMREEASKFLPP